jgi:hypothetical protein
MVDRACLATVLAAAAAVLAGCGPSQNNCVDAQGRQTAHCSRGAGGGHSFWAGGGSRGGGGDGAATGVSRGGFGGLGGHGGGAGE